MKRGTPIEVLTDAADTQHVCVLTWREARQVLAHIRWLTEKAAATPTLPEVVRQRMTAADEAMEE